jgi:hypothetical protein
MVLILYSGRLSSELDPEDVRQFVLDIRGKSNPVRVRLRTRKISAQVYRAGCRGENA